MDGNGTVKAGQLHGWYACGSVGETRAPALRSMDERAACYDPAGPQVLVVDNWWPNNLTLLGTSAHAWPDSPGARGAARLTGDS
jgi:hypothetical protein